MRSNFLLLRVFLKDLTKDEKHLLYKTVKSGLWWRITAIWWIWMHWNSWVKSNWTNVFIMQKKVEKELLRLESVLNREKTQNKQKLWLWRFALKGYFHSIYFVIESISHKNLNHKKVQQSRKNLFSLPIYIITSFRFLKCILAL